MMRAITQIQTGRSQAVSEAGLSSAAPGREDAHPRTGLPNRVPGPGLVGATLYMIVSGVPAILNRDHVLQEGVGSLWSIIQSPAASAGNLRMLHLYLRMRLIRNAVRLQTHRLRVMPSAHAMTNGSQACHPVKRVCTGHGRHHRQALGKSRSALWRSGERLLSQLPGALEKLEKAVILFPPGPGSMRYCPMMLTPTGHHLKAGSLPCPCHHLLSTGEPYSHTGPIPTGERAARQHPT